MTSRWTSLVTLTGLIAGFFLPVHGLGIPMCYMKVTTGIPCPGCGLTRAVSSALQGHFALAWDYNPFGYGFALFFVLTAPLFFLTRNAREKLQNYLKPYDAKVFVFLLIYITVFVIYGIARVFLVEFRAPGYEWWNSRDEVPPSYRADSHGVRNNHGV